MSAKQYEAKHVLKASRHQLHSVMYVHVSKVPYFASLFFDPWQEKRLTVHTRAAAEKQTGSEPCCCLLCLFTVFALPALVLTSVLQLASCIYQLLTKLHYHDPLWGAGSAHLTDVPQTNIQQLLAQIYWIKNEHRQGRLTVDILVY